MGMTLLDERFHNLSPWCLMYDAGAVLGKCLLCGLSSGSVSFRDDPCTATKHHGDPQSTNRTFNMLVLSSLVTEVGEGTV